MILQIRVEVDFEESMDPVNTVGEISAAVLYNVSRIRGVSDVKITELSPEDYGLGVAPSDPDEGVPENV